METWNMHIKPDGALHPRIYVLTEFPSPEEIIRNKPFCGSVGHAFDKLLNEANLLRSDCYFSYACLKGLPPDNKNKIDAYYPKAKKDVLHGFHQYLHDRWVHPEIAKSQERVKEEIARIKPDVILAMGNAAMHLLTGQWGIQAWRGSLDYYEGIPVIPTFTMQYLFRVWDQRPVILNDLLKVRKILLGEVAKEPEWKFTIRPTFEQVEERLLWLINQCDNADDWFAAGVDIETRGGHINCIGVAWSTTEAICIPLISLERPGGYFELKQEGRIVYLLYKLLTHPRFKNVGQNYSYDVQYIFRAWHFIPGNLQPGGVEDTMLMQHVLYPGMEKGLGFLSSLHSEHHVYWKDEGKLWNPNMPEEEHWEYNAKDCCRTLGVYYSLKETLEKEGLLSVYHRQAYRCWRSVLMAMLRGVRVDEARRRQMQTELFQKINQMQAKINRLVGHELNVDSSPQMKRLFYEDLGQKIIYAKKANEQGIKMPTVDSDALDTIMEREPLLAPLCCAIQELRSLGVFYSTFACAKLDYDRRMRSNYNVAGTETFRLASRQNPFGSGMNLQNIPKGNE